MMLTEAPEGMEPMANTIPYAATGTSCTHLGRSFIRELLLGQNPQGYAALCRAIAASNASDYAAINVPFFLIAGEQDKSATMEGCQYIFSHVRCTNKRMERLADVGHWHCIEAPERVGRLLEDFVGKVYHG